MYFSVAGNKNDVNKNDNGNNIIFTIKDTKLYVPVATLWARDNQKLLKLLSKGFEKSVYWDEYKTKCENEDTTNGYKYFLESNFVVVNRLFVSVYKNHGNNTKKFKKLKNQRNDIKIFSRKCNSIIKDDELSRSQS